MTNLRYFQTLDSHTKAYLIGFIAADGCVYRTHYKSGNGYTDQLCIYIQERDRIILDTLKVELNSTNKISWIPAKNQVGFRIASKDLCSDLAQYGISHRKSLTMSNTYPLIPEEFQSSFTLGYFDGDGCMYRSFKGYLDSKGNKLRRYNRFPYMHICGTKEFLIGMAGFFKLDQVYIKQVGNIHRLVIQRKSDVLKSISAMYKDSPIWLQRKKDNSYIVNQDGTISSL